MSENERLAYCPHCKDPFLVRSRTRWADVLWVIMFYPLGFRPFRCTMCFRRVWLWRKTAGRLKSVDHNLEESAVPTPASTKSRAAKPAAVEQKS